MSDLRLIEDNAEDLKVKAHSEVIQQVATALHNKRVCTMQLVTTLLSRPESVTRAPHSDEYLYLQALPAVLYAKEIIQCMEDKGVAPWLPITEKDVLEEIAEHKQNMEG